jgi:hypothetical protein
VERAAKGLDSVVVSSSELDAEKVQVLGQWAAGLRADPREELAAAGRAIELLIEEIERLHVLLWERQLFPDAAGTGGVPAVASETAEVDDGPGIVEEDAGPTLRGRLLRRFHSADASNS